MLETARRDDEPGQGLANFQYMVGQELYGRDRNGDAYRPGMGKVLSVVGDPNKPSELLIHINLHRMGLRALDLHRIHGLEQEADVKFTPQDRSDDRFIMEGRMPCPKYNGWTITLNEGKLWLM